MPPPDFSPQTITLGDYLLFPGMLVWYAVLPIALAAMFVAAGDMLRGRAGGLSLGIALFSAALFVLAPGPLAALFGGRVEVAAAYAIPLLLITVAMIGVQKLLLSRKGFVSQTGKGGERPVEMRKE